MHTALNNSVLPVKELLLLENLAIPGYQRPYKWTQKHVAQLFHDLQTHHDKSAYRLGSVVFHQRLNDGAERLDIVDGQQRTLTLMLAVWALIETRLAALDRQDLKDSLGQLRPAMARFMGEQRFGSEISRQNLHQNHQEIKRLVSRDEFTEAHIGFLLHQCEVVVFTLTEVSEAFQFFDSQNARGRDLEPHDLLKAFHLREFSEHENELKALTVAHWEGLESVALAKLFAIYLYRIRQWAQGRSARYFGKDQVDMFKGVNIDKVAYFPYVESLRITHHFVDEYNCQYQRKIDGNRMAFPFHLDQMIINGRRFFEMAEHYQQQIAGIVASEQSVKAAKKPVCLKDAVLGDRASEIFYVLNTYKARSRDGDRYIRSIFDCAVIFYLDKFGSQDLSRAIEKIFIWAYRCRIKQEVVQLATMDKHVLNDNLFRVIREATAPGDVLSVPLESLKAADNKNNRSPEDAAQDPLVCLFKDMNYYE